ncbi:S1 family peptidase [Aequorivita capsosiphonis]|uniref:S1 family peptidase n=1 Tax=Aequorivita capsosiphonis TaxID=487317 RepID=UPI00040BD3A2|nr:serine protease [Aequorivita capsosiphonis]
MRNNLKKIIVFQLLLFISFLSSAQPSNTTIENLKSAIVRIESGRNIGTGFLWKNKNWVVTTLHVIDNFSKIEITLANDVKSAKVLKVLKEHDLVLLELESASNNLTIISNINSSPQINSSLYTMGYNGKGNLNSIIDRTLRLGYNSNGKLEGLLSKTIKDALNICKRPNPSIEIFYLDGSLLPGFSGSPIIDGNGNLVGIADGGLEEGASSISWGVKADRLATLLNSNESFPHSLNCGTGAKVSFASENLLEESHVDYIEYGQFKFIKTKVRSVEEMMYTIDDPAGLQQIINGYSMMNNTNYLQFKYDIYEDLHSGLTICVPQGTKLSVNNDLIMGDFGDEDLKIIIDPYYNKYLDPNPTLRYVNDANNFQQKIVAIDGGYLMYQKDLNLSYRNGPILRYDGIKVNREAYRGYAMETNEYGQFENVSKTFSFQTHIGRGNYYMGAAALNMNSTIENANDLNFCLSNGQCNTQNQSSICENVCNRYKLFSQLVIGVHMVGFSNNYNRR